MSMMNGSWARFFCLVVSFLLLTPMAQAQSSGSTSFYYPFSSAGVVEEVGSLLASSSPYWWINSGGRLIIKDGVGQTIQGSLTALDPWRVLYAASSPADTDNGYHPQNLFRLVSKSKWQDVRAEGYFKITKNNFSSSSNRNASNGLLLMSRYQGDGQTLYYAGIRVDGTAVIKKKLNGTYTTLAQKALYAGTYDRADEPTLLPGNRWLGLKSETTTNPDGSVTVKLYTDSGRTGAWKLVLTANDKTSPIKSEGYAGVRTDFMDVYLDDIKFSSLN